MSNWQSTLNRFRELGGVADNVMLSYGDYGRGIFPINPKLPVKILVPGSLLLPQDCLEINDNYELALNRNCDWSPDKKDFYLSYLNAYAFGSDFIQSIVSRRKEINLLPEKLKSMLKGFGVSDFFFNMPDPLTCLIEYKNSRRILSHDNKLVLMPFLELVNHDENSKKTFIKNHDISISGKFSDEVLINYSMGGDPMLMYETYGFSNLKSCSYSGALSVSIGERKIKISRHINLYNSSKEGNIPILLLNEDEVHLSFLVTSDLNNKQLPKKIFQKLMKEIAMPTDVASDVFDGIVNMNRQFFKNLLNELETLEGDVVSNLRVMTFNQLAALG